MVAFRQTKQPPRIKYLSDSLVFGIGKKNSDFSFKLVFYDESALREHLWIEEEWLGSKQVHLRVAEAVHCKHYNE